MLLNAEADPNAPVFAEYAGDMVERFLGLVAHDGPDVPEDYPMEWLRPGYEPTAPLFIAIGSPAGYCVDWDTLPRVVEVLLDHGANARQAGSVLSDGARVTTTPLAYLLTLNADVEDAETRLRDRDDQAPHNLSHPDNRRLVEETADLLRRHTTTT